MFRYSRILLLILLLFPLLALAGKRRYPYPVDRHGHPIYLSQDTWVSDNRILVQRPDSLYGYLDGEQREAIPCIYQFAEPFCNGKALVMLNGKYGVIDTNGKEVVPFEFSIIGHPYALQDHFCTIRYARATKDSVEGIFDIKEHRFYPRIADVYYYDIYDPASLLWKVTKRVNGRRLFGLANSKGECPLPIEYNYIGGNNEMYICVARDGRWGFASLSGKEVVPTIYDSAKDFSNGFAAVKLNGKWGFVNKKGQLAIGCKYDVAGSFEYNGMATVRREGQWGVVDTQGIERIRPVWQEVKVFSYGFALKQNGKWALADAKGIQRTAFIYDSAWWCANAFVVKQRGLFGLCSKDFRDSLP